MIVITVIVVIAVLLLSFHYTYHPATPLGYSLAWILITSPSGILSGRA